MAFSKEQQKAMAQLVSRALYAAVAGTDYQLDSSLLLDGLESNSGCFITLKTNNQLRGCIGCFTSAEPLYQTLIKYTRASALEDPRFVMNRIQLNELAAVNIDISVLSPLQNCLQPENIELGVDGIYIVKGTQHGCFLPQVAAETGWSVDEFWGNCCSQKAGLSYTAWQEDDIELYTFKAEVFEFQYLPI